MSGGINWGAGQQGNFGKTRSNTPPQSDKFALAEGGAIAPINPLPVDQGTSVSVTRDPRDTQFTPSSSTPVRQVLTNRSLDAQTLGENLMLRQGANSFDGKLASIGVNFDPLENPLNIYASYAYHIRFFFGTEEQSYSSNLDSANPNTDGMVKTIIAESGVTVGFNITSLRMDSTAGANREKRNMWFPTEMTMIITEPLGMSLMDRIFSASQDMGISNYVRAPYFVEIWFTGYDEDGNIVSDGQWHSLHRVVILNIDANMTQVGATYTVKMASDGSIGEMNQYATPPATLKIKATTLGQFWRGLQAAWNDAVTNLNSDKLARTEYVIKYPPVWNSWTLKDVAVAQQNARNTDMSAVVDGPDTVVSIAKGQSVENIVNWVTYLSSEAVKWITGQGSVGPNGASLKEQGMIRYVAVYPKVEIIGWDVKLKDYVRRVTYSLVPVESLRSYTDMTSVQALSTPNVTQAKLNYLIQNKRLVKRYDYLYTGKNTEVIRFDVNLENYWSIVQPIWDQVNSYDQFAVGGVASQNSVGWEKVKGTYTKDLLTIGNRIAEIDNLLRTGQIQFEGPQALLSEKQGLQAQQQDLQQRLAAGQQQSANTGANTSATRSGANEILFNNLSPGGVTVDQALAKVPEVSEFVQQRRNFYTSRQGALATKYLEDYSRIQGSRSPQPLPVSGMFDTRPYSPQAIQNADQNKVMKFSNDPTSYGPGTGYVGAIFGNLFDKNFFLEIELEIRGDPWWIPIGNMQQNAIAESQATSSNPVNGNFGSANFIGGDNAILFETRLGIEIDEDTGLADLSQSVFYNGIYMVLEVRNDFNNGKFTQTLKCAKDVLEQVGNQVQQTATGQNPSTSTTVPNPTNDTGGTSPTIPGFPGVPGANGESYGVGGLSG